MDIIDFKAPTRILMQQLLTDRDSLQVTDREQQALSAMTLYAVRALLPAQELKYLIAYAGLQTDENADSERAWRTVLKKELAFEQKRMIDQLYSTMI